MKKVMYSDCNNNVDFLKNIFNQIHSFATLELKWNITNIELIPIDQGDFIGGVPDSETERVYDFQQKILREGVIEISHEDWIKLLENVKTIYDGIFLSICKDVNIKIKVFDGDIIEIEGDIEDKINLNEY